MDDRPPGKSCKGSFVGASSVVYALLVAVCLVVHYMAAWGQYPVLLGAAWLVVETWTLVLLGIFLRTRICGCAAWFANLVFGQASAGNQPRTAKTTRTGRGSWFSFVSCEMQGWRSAMEDAVVCVPALDGAVDDMALFAVFDGHGGAEVSAFAADHVVECVRKRLASEEGPAAALKQALLDLEGNLRERNTSGSIVRAVHPHGSREVGRFDFVGCTAVVVLLTNKTVAVVGVGDSRVFKCRKGECVPLTRDHKPESPRERRRIEQAGGTVVKFGPCHRVDYNLNLSRSLGDFQYKDPSLAPEDQKISPVGDVTIVDIDEQDEFLVVACDGLFELMTWKSVCSYVHERIRHAPLASIAEGLLDECCSPNIVATCGRGTDNESVIIVKLHDL